MTKKNSNSTRRRETTRALPSPPPGRVGKGEQGEGRRTKNTPNGGPHLELGRLRLKTWSKSDFSIAQTTGQHICTYIGRVLGTVCRTVVAHVPLEDTADGIFHLRIFRSPRHIPREKGQHLRPQLVQELESKSETTYKKKNKKKSVPKQTGMPMPRVG